MIHTKLITVKVIIGTANMYVTMSTAFIHVSDETKPEKDKCLENIERTHTSINQEVNLELNLKMRYVVINLKSVINM